MLQRFSLSLLVIALATLPAKAQTQLAPALAPVVLLDQPPNQVSLFFSDASCDFCGPGSEVIAANFVQVLPVAPTGITEIIIWGGWFLFNTQTTDDWTVIIHTDAGGLPGGVFYTQANFAATSIVSTGVVVGGIDEYMVTLDISPDLATPPGTYWVEIYHDSGFGGTDDWVWETGTLDAANGIPGFASASEAPGVIWGPVNFDIAIKINGDDAVPVELISFNATVNGTDVVLNWETSSETNNAGFETQMLVGENWDVLGWVEGHGTTTEAQSYSYTAENIGVGTHTFRLKQIDYDGAFEYHGEVEATIETPGTHLISSAYPNPFNPQSQFTLAVAQDQHVTAELFNTLGKRIAVLFAGTVEANQVQSVTIDGAGLPSGMYIVRVIGDRFSDALSVTLLK